MSLRSLAARNGPTLARAATAGLAACLLLGAAALARQFRLDAVREFEFAWTTWGAALALAFAAGAMLSVSVPVGVGRAVAVVTVLVSVVVLLHLPVVIVGVGAWGTWPLLTRASLLDRTAPQLLAAVVAGAAVARLAGGSTSVRRRRRQPVQ